MSKLRIGLYGSLSDILAMEYFLEQNYDYHRFSRSNYHYTETDDAIYYRMYGYSLDKCKGLVLDQIFLYIDKDGNAYGSEYNIQDNLTRSCVPEEFKVQVIDGRM